MYKITDLKPGTYIQLGGQPFLVIASSHSKLGRGGGIMKTKIKNLLDGTVTEHVFKGEEKIEEASIINMPAQYLYSQNNQYYFMDPNSFDQMSLGGEKIGEAKNYLKEGQIVDIIHFQNQPLNITLPVKIDLKVVEAPPGIRGDRVSAATKEVVAETGARIKTPLFIKEGDMIRIDTRTGEYVERVKVE